MKNEIDEKELNSITRQCCELIINGKIIYRGDVALQVQETRYASPVNSVGSMMISFYDGIYIIEDNEMKHATFDELKECDHIIAHYQSENSPHGVPPWVPFVQRPPNSKLPQLVPKKNEPFYESLPRYKKGKKK